MTDTTVLTIGHSTHTLERLLALLQMHGVTAIADVRSTPYSRMNPDFNREVLQKALEEDGIAYVFLGNELGARSQDPACYEAGRVQYRRLAETPLFQSGLERVIQGAKRYRLALLCAEKEPLDCHRTILVSRELEARRVPVTHIHADGRLERHTDVIARLRSSLGIAEADLFRSDEEATAQAYRLQEERIAYVDRSVRAAPESAR